jgi:hypothetical protein
MNIFEKLYNIKNKIIGDNVKSKLEKINDPFQTYKFNYLWKSLTPDHQLNAFNYYYKFINTLSNTNDFKKHHGDWDTFLLKNLSLNNYNFDYFGEFKIFIKEENWYNTNTNTNANTIMLANFNFTYEYFKFKRNYNKYIDYLFFRDSNDIKLIKKTLNHHYFVIERNNFNNLDNYNFNNLDNYNFNNINYSDRQKKLKKYFNNIINFSTKRFLIFNVSKLGINKEQRHANIILLDKIEKTIEYYEPWGSKINIKNINIISNLFPSDYSFIYTNEFQNNNDIQSVFSEIDNRYCTVYCIWYVFLRINNVNISKKSIIDYMLSYNKNIDCKEHFNLIKKTFEDYKIKYIIEKYPIIFENDFYKNDDKVNINIYDTFNPDFSLKFNENVKNRPDEYSNLMNLIKFLKFNLFKDSFKEKLLQYNDNLNIEVINEFIKKLDKNIDEILKKITNNYWYYFINYNQNCNKNNINTPRKEFTYKVNNVLFTICNFIYTYYNLLHTKNLKWFKNNFDKIYKNNIDLKNINKNQVKDAKDWIIKRINKYDINNYLIEYKNYKLKNIYLWYIQDDIIFKKSYYDTIGKYIHDLFYENYFEINKNNNTALFFINNIGYNNIFDISYIPYTKLLLNIIYDIKDWIIKKNDKYDINTVTKIKEFLDIHNIFAKNNNILSILKSNVNDLTSFTGFFIMNSFYILLNNIKTINERKKLIEYLHLQSIDYFFYFRKFNYDMKHNTNFKPKNDIDFFIKSEENFFKGYKFKKKQKLIPKSEYKKRLKENPIEFIRQRKKEIVLSIQ